jgi:hypothetical protein
MIRDTVAASSFSVDLFLFSLEPELEPLWSG